ncbi:MAG: MBL fold metallo-hydrolase [Woeseiaceae bacterium]|nr:MBL fold metallo-hydrolase [Woeseiaceae bacterium]
MLRSLLLPIALFSTVAGAIEITELQSGAWAALQPANNRFNDCNSLIVEAQDYLIVVDAQEGRADVEAIIEFTRNTVRKPVRYLINTHWHGDHTLGNTLYREAFGEELRILGHATQAIDIPERAATAHTERVAELQQQLPAAREQLVTGIKRDGSRFSDQELAAQTARVGRAQAWLDANRDASFTGPSVTIDSAFTVDAGVATFTVHPQRGHTRGDLVIHFPRLQILAAGDLVDVMPYSGHGYPGEWLDALRFIDELDFSVIVPGHGPALHDRMLIARLSDYFESLTGQVSALAGKGMDLEEIRESVDLAASRESLAGSDTAAAEFFDAVQDEAIERAYAEVAGNE